MNVAELNIQSVLKNYSVLLTGASGFVGMEILKKLVEIIINNNMVNKRKIYIILRKSRAYPSVSERLQREILNNELWNEYKDNMSTLNDIIHPIEGDLIYDNLGVSEKDINLINYECNSNNNGLYVIHCAAAVQFNLHFNDAMNLNVFGTYSCGQLGKLLNAQGFIHISTLYCNCREHGDATINEEIYSQGFDSNEIFETWLHKKSKKYDNKEIKKILSLKRSKTIENEETTYSWPNTYTITKNIAENVIVKYCKENNIKLSIARLGIISPAYRGKDAGWFIGNGGFVFVAIGAASGHLKYLNGNGLGRPDVVPVDYTVNALMGICAQLLKNDIIIDDKPTIYQIGLAASQPEDWNVAQIFEYATPRWHASNIPGTKPDARVKFIPNNLLFNLISLCLYDIPLLLLLPIQYIFDWYINYFYSTNNLTSEELIQLQMKLKKSKINKIKKQIAFMQKARKKMVFFENNYTFFMNQRWKFNNSNVSNLYNICDNESKKEYDFNIKDININEYALNNGMTIMKKWYEAKARYNEQMELQHQASLKNQKNNGKINDKTITRVSQIRDIIKKMGLSVIGVSITHYGISLLATLFLLWAVFVFA